MMRKLLSFLAGITSAASGCGPYSPADHAVAVPSQDSAIEDAARQARATLDRFSERLASPGPGQRDFSIKIPVSDGNATHYLWLQDVAVDDAGFRGKLGPDAAGVGHHRPGEHMKVDRQQVEDWMYVEDGKLVGGLSLRAIRGKLSGKAREAFDRGMWFRFE